jgi:tol-pal system protein YbgF
MRQTQLRLWVWAAIGIVVGTGVLGCATRDQYLRLRREVHEMRRYIADSRADLEAQRRELQALRGQVETLGRGGRPSSIGGAHSIEARVAALEGRASGRPVVPVGSAPPAGSAEVGKELAAVGGELPGADEYRTALALLEQRNYDEAIPRLRSYLRKYPSTALSDNAQYWIGECYYAKRDFNNAILAFYDVTRRYPKGDKVCAAMLKQGLAFAELGDTADARIVLERLVQAHPNCEEVGRARAELTRLTQG